MDDSQAHRESFQMDDILDDEFEITLESPRDQASSGDKEDSILKLIQLGGNSQGSDENTGIPTIVVTDANEVSLSQNDVSDDEGRVNEDIVNDVSDDEGGVNEDIVLEKHDNFTAIVDKTDGTDQSSADIQIDTEGTEEPVTLTNLADAQEVNLEDTIDVRDVAENVDAEISYTSKQQNDTSTDLKYGLHFVDADIQNGVDADSQQQTLEVGEGLQGNIPEGKVSSTQMDEGINLKNATCEEQVSSLQPERIAELEEGSISLDSILVKEKAEDSDPDEFDFDLPAQKPQAGSDRQVTFKDAKPVTAVQQSAEESHGSEDVKKNVAVAGNPDLSNIKPGNKPIAVIKPTTQVSAANAQSKNQVAEATVSVTEQRNQRVLESAQAEWDNVATITAGFSDKGTAQGPEPTVIETTPAMSPHEMTEYLKTADFSQVKSTIRTVVERRGFSAFVHMLFGPPKLNRSLIQERDMIFCTAASSLSNENSYHTRTLQTIYRCLTGSKFDCPRTGSHWEEIGFQGNDPATDLRGAGLLGLVNLLFFLKDPKRQGIASDIYRLSLHPTQNFPFCVMGINMSRITLQSLREDILNKECNRRGDVLGVVNDFYVGLYLQMYQVWKSQGKTIQDSGYVIKDLETSAKKNPRSVLKNLDDYLNKKKTLIVAERLPDSGGDKFLSICDDEP